MKKKIKAKKRHLKLLYSLKRVSDKGNIIKEKQIIQYLYAVYHV